MSDMLPETHAASPASWTVLPLPGLTLDSLGSYLAGLGLLSVASRRWQGVRGCWQQGRLALINGPKTLVELEDVLWDIAARAAWSPYGRSWKAAQEKDSRKKTGSSTSNWRALSADEDALATFHSHVACGSRLSFNPLFGSGGNSGNRGFDDGWQEAVSALRAPPRKWKPEKLRADLDSFLVGNACECLAGFNASSWFSAANKAFNSGTARPFRDGQVTPWAMALACEAFPLLQGSPSRQLGRFRRATGAFPFVTTAAAPEVAGEAGRCVGEVWLPVWDRPMTLPEVSTLFSRGRAEVRGRGATTAPAFAAAVLQRGVDAGIREFRRFVLLHTTSENTFESRLASVVPVASGADAALAEALNRALVLRDSLPAERKKGQRWLYQGLRGPLDRALVELAEAPSAERACSVVDAMVTALRKVDRNRAHRAAKPPVQFQLLPGMWAASLLDEHGDSARPETRLALAIATLRPGVSISPAEKRSVGPFLPYWLGVEAQDIRGRFWRFPESVPFRRVWGAGSLPANFIGVLQRRLVEEEPEAEPPFGASYRADLGDIALWLRGETDEAELERWLLRLSFFDWDNAATANLRNFMGQPEPIPIADGTLALFGLFKPLFESFLLKQLLPAGSRRKTAKAGPLPQLVAQLARGDVSSAVELATSAYRGAGVTPASLPRSFAASNCPRLLAALLIPTASHGLTASFRDSSERWIPPLSHRWLSPNKQNKDRT
jgi:CRISPR-associated protein Csx17